jgi:hypothetical protein
MKVFTLGYSPSQSVRRENKMTEYQAWEIICNQKHSTGDKIASAIGGIFNWALLIGICWVGYMFVRFLWLHS